VNVEEEFICQHQTTTNQQLPPPQGFMTLSIPAIYENGVFRPTGPVVDLAEHSSVRLTVEPAPGVPPTKRVWGLQRDKVLYIAPDFDDELDDDFWFPKE
jgi:hypothetical protein